MASSSLSGGKTECVVELGDVLGSPACNPRYLYPKLLAEVNAGRVERLPPERGPEFQLVAVTLTTVTVVPPARQVNREVSRTVRLAIVPGTSTVPLITTAMLRFKGH